ncbi:uncharacterized protein Tco025E_05141 [Trypanosoma conorhini]|uniref:Uncharacterized protein n=1 Tax=Trypanosoma conorhini TaxID=83891 RepID=A0A422PG21_9TRYP|nr:uncharacterized protein Tco025E_05141 [Trypanosoma conorhini]RNF16672.1 hypothetical protein Tco025E_05141 [Trypanosoma conorhini]
MPSGSPQSLASALDRPDSFEDWLLGTHYSHNYLAALRLQGRPSPVASRGQPKVISVAKGKQHSRTPHQGMSPRPNVSANNGVQGMKKRQQHDAKKVGEENAEMVLPNSGISTGRRNNAALGTTEAHLDDPLDAVATRDLLRDSYYRIRNSCTGTFPPLLTPFKRSLWTYKTVNDTQGELFIGGRAIGEKHDLSDASYSLKNSHDIVDVPFDQRPVKVRNHPSTGPPCFAPTPTSYRWLTSMR